MSGILGLMRRVAMAGSVLGVASCSSFVHPIGSNIEPVSIPEGSPVNIEEAVTYGRALRAEYQSNIDDQFLLRNLTDLALVPILGAAAFYGISRSHSDVLLGLTVGGTSTYVLGQRFANVSDQLIYASGGVALGCALGSFESQHIAFAYRPILVELVGGPVNVDGRATNEQGSVLKTVVELETLLRAAGKEDAGIVLEARALIETARNVRNATGRSALNALDKSGGDLVEAINDIKAQVAKSLLDNQIDGGKFKDALNTAFSSSNVGIFQLPDQIPDQGTGQTALSANLERNILRKMAELRDQVRSVREIAKEVGRPPSVEELRKCDLDVDSAGLTLSVSRPGPIPVPLTGTDGALAAPITIGFAVMGGRPPYDANWAGVYSGRLEKPRISSGGALTATLPGGLRKGAYELEIRDTSTRGVPLVVKIQVGTPPASPGAGGVLQSEGPTADEIRNIREALNVTGESGPIVRDSETDKALAKFIAEKEGVPIASVSNLTIAEKIARALELLKDQSAVSGSNPNGSSGVPTSPEAKLIRAFVIAASIKEVDHDDAAGTPKQKVTIDGGVGPITRQAMRDHSTEKAGKEPEPDATDQALVAAMKVEIIKQVQQDLHESGRATIDHDSNPAT